METNHHERQVRLANRLDGIHRTLVAYHSGKDEPWAHPGEWSAAYTQALGTALRNAVATFHEFGFEPPTAPTKQEVFCAECGERFPCSQANRTDIPGSIRARHHVKLKP